MKSATLFVTAFAVIIGGMVGRRTGFASGGSAVNGQALIALLFGVIAFLASVALPRIAAARDSVDNTDDSAGARSPV